MPVSMKKNRVKHLCLRCGWVDSNKWLQGEHNMHNYDWSLSIGQ